MKVSKILFLSISMFLSMPFASSQATTLPTQEELVKRLNTVIAENKILRDQNVVASEDLKKITMEYEKCVSGKISKNPDSSGSAFENGRDKNYPYYNKIQQNKNTGIVPPSTRTPSQQPAWNPINPPSWYKPSQANGSSPTTQLPQITPPKKKKCVMVTLPQSGRLQLKCE